MNAPRLSEDLVEWARQAGYALTPEDPSDAALLWSDPGGEIRFYIRRQSDEQVILTRAERAGEEQFELAGLSVEVVERHLYGVFGWEIRRAKRVPRIKVPRRTEEIVGDYHISHENDDGVCHLVDEAGTSVATASGGITGVTTLVTLSHLVASTPDDIKRSYESPDGRPLFTI